MKRREFLKTAGAGLAVSTAVAAPAIAQSMPELKWRCTTSWPKSLDVPFSASETISKYVAEASDNKFQIQAFAGGEIVPALQAVDAVSNATVEMCHTAAYYFIGKDPTFALYCSVPFGLNSRQQNAWFQDHGGQDMLNEFGKKYKLYGISGGNTGTQMGGWFRKEINTVEDLNGLKMRIGGWAGKTLSKLGTVPQQIAGGDIYPALEKGTIDATEWVGPYDDEKLGFYKVAKYYYYPGWWRAGPRCTSSSIRTSGMRCRRPINRCSRSPAATPIWTFRRDTTRAIRRRSSAWWPMAPSCARSTRAIMEACLKASNEVNAETSASNPDFKKIYDLQMAFRDDGNLWWQVAEYTFETFMIRTRPKG